MIQAISKDDPFYKAYFDQRHNAARRKVKWLFEFHTWKQWWIDTGKWDQRGKGRNNYVMARNGDTGPYAPWNVKCVTVAENGYEANVGFRRNPSGRKGQNVLQDCITEQV